MFTDLKLERFHHEYWPWWLFYLPLVPVWFWWAIKNRSLTWFTATNTNMPHGGFFGESKHDILQQIPQQHRPAWILVEPCTTWFSLLNKLEEAGLSLPLVCKPNVGERGNGVAKIDTMAQLESYLKQANEPFIAQAFIHYPIELGVFFVKMPGQSEGRVTSVTMKRFLQVCGDGQLSIAQLLSKQVRGKIQLSNPVNLPIESLARVPSFGEEILLEPIGNHCRGTTFLNGNHLITEELHAAFNHITRSLDGFYYGRFDIKVASLADLQHGKNLLVMELNGASSEPGHVYDPSGTYFQAWRDVAWHWGQLGKIALHNQKLGIKPTSLKEVLTTVWQHFFPKPQNTGGLPAELPNLASAGLG